MDQELLGRPDQFSSEHRMHEGDSFHRSGWIESILSAFVIRFRENEEVQKLARLGVNTEEVLESIQRSGDGVANFRTFGHRRIGFVPSFTTTTFPMPDGRIGAIVFGLKKGEDGERLLAPGHMRAVLLNALWSQVGDHVPPSTQFVSSTFPKVGGSNRGDPNLTAIFAFWRPRNEV